MRSRMISYAVLIGALSLAGCEKYKARPLNPELLVIGVEQSRLVQPIVVDGKEAPASPVPFTFVHARELMRMHSPSLKQVEAEYQTAMAAAGIRTPLPNPTLEVGPRFGFGPGVSTMHRLQPFGAIGFTIPTGPKRRRQDDVNQALADVARVEVEAKLSELYLDLRRNFARLVLSRDRIRARQEIAASSRKSTESTRKLVEGGQLTALDTGLIQMEQARVENELLDGELDAADVVGELSQLIGVASEHFEILSEHPLPIMPTQMPNLKELRDKLTLNHPELARLRAQYDLAERQLRLEIAKQYPDFRFGPSYEGDTGEKKIILGLTLGIDLPVFDHNHQAIATANHKREEIRLKYEAAANRAMAAMDRALRRYRLASEKLKQVETVMLPSAQKNLDLARKSVEAGAFDTLRLLEAERSQRALLITRLDADLALRSAWIDLEQAVGIPLLLFPGETSSVSPITSEPKANNSQKDQETK